MIKSLDKDGDSKLNQEEVKPLAIGIIRMLYDSQFQEEG